MYRGRLERDLSIWVDKGLITEDAAERMLGEYDARPASFSLGRVLMVRGADAGDGAMLTSFGSHELGLFRVWCDELPPMSDAEVLKRLETRPEAEALVSGYVAA